MPRQPKWNIADTNFGSKLEKDAHYQAGAKEQAWADPKMKVGIEPGLWIWRIEKFTVKPWPKENQPTKIELYIFYIKSYKKNKETEALSHDIHFWLGLESSQDEVGTAAYKTVELDDFLGTSPIQHREVQDNESNLFLSYFKKFHVEEGGIDSGFKHNAVHEYRHRLLKVKLIGRTIVIREVPKDYKSLNSGDVFVLDVGTTLYQLNGKNSQGVEKVKAAEFVQATISDRNGLAHVIVIDEGDREMGKFWEALGCEGPIKSAAEDTVTDISSTPKKLFRVSDASGTLKFTEEKTGTVKMCDFDTNDVFVFDAGHQVFVWIGLKSTITEKKYSLHHAEEYIKKHNRPSSIPITRVMQGGENDVFTQCLDV
ncbi:1177_t:CDS:10 [Scutellospora calospora]|uniref:1177_t:CDS:1 n=1 Tax=Scutellospora calospora TaxID=85575 RepID=A0ACA9KDT9_9GLOM|nr:1177_t:CDS:10 [Scutellospora calospora]